MKLPQLTLHYLKSQATAQSFARGEDYWQSHAVEQAILRGDVLFAKVEGNTATDYDVTIKFKSRSVEHANCSCPYDYEGWCKHIVATLLTCIHQPQTVIIGSTLEESIAPLDLIQTRYLLSQIVVQFPELMTHIEHHVGQMLSKTPTTVVQDVKSPSRCRPVNTKQYYQAAKRIFEDCIEDYYDDPYPGDAGFCDLVLEAEQFIYQGDSESARAILESLTQACIDHWIDCIGEEDGDVAVSLDEAWTKVILMTDMTSTQQVVLQEKLQTWVHAGLHLNCSPVALEQGWTYPPLVQVLSGCFMEMGIWEGDPADCAEQLTTIRLDILDHEKRHQEYLYLAESESFGAEYLAMLVRLGQHEEIWDLAPVYLNNSREYLQVAQALQVQGLTAEALKFGQLGLAQVGESRSNLATWISNLALE